MSTRQAESLRYAGADCLQLYQRLHLTWLSRQQGAIERRLFSARRGRQKPELFLYDVTSSYLEGRDNELAEDGYNRDGKKGNKQIVIGLGTQTSGHY